MSKLTKRQQIDALQKCLRTQGIKMRELETRLSTQEKWSEYADNMLTELNHALPDPEYDAKCEAQEADINASLDRHRERLCLNKPQLKQLDQSVFKGSPDWAVSAAISPNGKAYVYSVTGDGFYGISDKHGYQIKGGDRANCIGDNYDTSNWQNSLIERDIAKELTGSELTGSELVRAMLERGDRCVMCMVANNEANMFLATRPVVVHGCTDSGFISVAGCYSFAVAVNNQGEPLTASEVGL